MKEIKFRTPHYLMASGKFSSFSYWGRLAVGTFVSPASSNFSDPAEDEMFTGLLDKTGHEIYEGDIVTADHHNPKNYRIEFREGGFCATWGNRDCPIDINHFYDSTGCSLTVVGNIHETPELSPKEKA